MSKSCSACRQEKTAEHFHFDRRRPDGLRIYCKECARGKTSTWRRRQDPETGRAQAIAWHKNNPERSKLSSRNTKLKAAYGISISDYGLLLEAQKGTCAICAKPETVVCPRAKRVKMLAVDHCHTSGKIRQLLCASCNHLLGHAKDDPEICNRAAEYLKRHAA
jgi:hypothetical protein